MTTSAARKPAPRKPAAARTPTDRQAPARAAKTAEVEDVEDVNLEIVDVELEDGFDEDGNPKFRTVPGRAVTVHGIRVAVADEALDDFELLDDLRAAQDDDDGSRMPSLMRRLVGPEYRNVLDQLRDPVTKRVRVSDGARFVWDLFRALNPNS